MKSAEAIEEMEILKFLNDEQTIQERFEEYHAKNPIVYKLLVDLARQAKAAGKNKLGISLLVERARWELMFKTESNDGFKISNDYRSRYARLIMDQEKDLQGMFEIRSIRRF